MKQLILNALFFWYFFILQRHFVFYRWAECNSNTHRCENPKLIKDKKPTWYEQCESCHHQQELMYWSVWPFPLHYSEMHTETLKSGKYYSVYLKRKEKHHVGNKTLVKQLLLLLPVIFHPGWRVWWRRSLPQQVLGPHRGEFPGLPESENSQ